MKTKRTILVFSDFGGFFLESLKALKEQVSADYILTSNDYELESIFKSLPISLTIVNCSSYRFSSTILNTLVKLTKHPILCLTDRETVLPSVSDSSTTLFTFPLSALTNVSGMIGNIKSILSLTENSIKSGSVESEKKSLAEEAREKSLCRYLMELEQKNKILAEVKQQIDKLCQLPGQTLTGNLRSISRSIQLNNQNRQYWDDFKLYFEETDPGFIKRLKMRHPNLTTKDIKYCCYLKMNMSNHDIKNLLNINQDSVRTHKSRLKRKLGLTKAEKLGQYFQSISPNQERFIA